MDVGVWSQIAAVMLLLCIIALLHTTWQLWKMEAKLNAEYAKNAELRYKLSVAQRLVEYTFKRVRL